MGRRNAAPVPEARRRVKLVLRALRALEPGLTARGLGARLGVTGAFVSAIEDPGDNRLPSFGLMDAYAAAFGVKPSDIMAAAEKLDPVDYRQALRTALDLTEPEA